MSSDFRQVLKLADRGVSSFHLEIVSCAAGRARLSKGAQSEKMHSKRSHIIKNGAIISRVGETDKDSPSLGAYTL